MWISGVQLKVHAQDVKLSKKKKKTKKRFVKRKTDVTHIFFNIFLSQWKYWAALWKVM